MKKIDTSKTAIKDCIICGEPIKYLVYVLIGEGYIKRRIPKAHNGACKHALRVRKAIRKVKKYKKEREIE